MSKGDRNKRDKDRVLVDGPWLALPMDFLASRRCHELSPMATKMLILALGQLRPGGGGNGRIDFHADRLTAAGWTSPASATAAIRELVGAGLLVKTLTGAKGRMGLFGVTLYPMHCKVDGLEVGPSAWKVSDWREGKGMADRPTRENAARWNVLRGGEKKREASPRGGSASNECPSATEVQGPPHTPCATAAVVRPPHADPNALPPRLSPSRDAIWSNTMNRTVPTSALARVLAQRTWRISQRPQQSRPTAYVLASARVAARAKALHSHQPSAAVPALT